MMRDVRHSAVARRGPGRAASAMDSAALFAAGAGLGGLAVAACFGTRTMNTSTAAAAGGPPNRKPYISVVRDGSPEARADAALSKAYALVRNGDGSMDNVMTIHSLNPATMESHAAIYMQCMKGASPLSKADREIVAVAASRCNRCTY